MNAYVFEPLFPTYSIRRYTHTLLHTTISEPHVSCLPNPMCPAFEEPVVIHAYIQTCLPAYHIKACVWEPQVPYVHTCSCNILMYTGIHSCILDDPSAMFHACLRPAVIYSYLHTVVYTTYMHVYGSSTFPTCSRNIRMHTYAYIYIYICKHIYIYIHIHTWMHIHIHTCILHTPLRMQLRTYINACAYIHTLLYS